MAVEAVNKVAGNVKESLIVSSLVCFLATVDFSSHNTADSDHFLGRNLELVIFNDAIILLVLLGVADVVRSVGVINVSSIKLDLDVVNVFTLSIGPNTEAKTCLAENVR